MAGQEGFEPSNTFISSIILEFVDRSDSKWTSGSTMTLRTNTMYYAIQ